MNEKEGGWEVESVRLNTETISFYASTHALYL